MVRLQPIFKERGERFFGIKIVQYSYGRQEIFTIIVIMKIRNIFISVVNT